MFFTLYREPHGQPLSTLHALEFGLAIALAAPIGDLLESYLKRDMGVKDTGRSWAGTAACSTASTRCFWLLRRRYFLALAIGRA